jgi:hypothetical protein
MEDHMACSYEQILHYGIGYVKYNIASFFAKKKWMTPQARRLLPDSAAGESGAKSGGRDGGETRTARS